MEVQIKEQLEAGKDPELGEVVSGRKVAFFFTAGCDIFPQAVAYRPVILFIWSP